MSTTCCVWVLRSVNEEGLRGGKGCVHVCGVGGLNKGSWVDHLAASMG